MNLKRPSLFPGSLPMARLGGYCPAWIASTREDGAITAHRK